MLDDLIKYIQSRLSPNDWKINGFSIGDDFDSLINDSALYEESTMAKRKGPQFYKGALFYKANDSNLIAGIFLPIPFFDTRQEEILNEIIKTFGIPYFDHVKMKNRILYYPSHNLYLDIYQNDISKGLCLSIGDSGIKLQTFTAANIIDSYFGLMKSQTLLLELEDRGSLPKLARVQIRVLESLLLAFLGDSSIKRFIDGAFIMECDDIYLNKLIKTLGEIEIYESRKRREPTVIDNPSRYELYKYWDALFKYYLDSQSYIDRTNVFNFTTWKKDQLEAMKIISSKESVISRLESLKNFLSKILDPEGKVFDLKEMISEYDYPKEDIASLIGDDY